LNNDNNLNNNQNRHAHPEIGNARGSLSAKIPPSSNVAIGPAKEPAKEAAPK